MKWDRVRSLLLIVAGVAILVSFRYPMWSIYLWSNSYPNGIGMSLYAYKPTDPPDVADMDGGMHELNVLNHFIGMKPITKDMMVFKLLPALLVVTAALLILAGVMVRRAALFKAALGAYLVTTLYGVGAFLYHLYEYGHDLDPQAAIKVPPFMPGIIGWNRIAQFETWSEFGWGTYLVVIGFLVAWGAYFVDRRIKRKAIKAAAADPVQEKR